MYRLKIAYTEGNYFFRALLGLVAPLIVASFYFFPQIQNFLEGFFATNQSTNQSIEVLGSLIQNIGVALIGASAIVASLVLFAMQVNIERLPYGLFRRVSKDLILLFAFSGASLLAILIATSSVLLNQNSLAFIVLCSLGGIFAIFVLFLYAYKRALDLVNPLQQIGMLIEKTRKEFDLWGKIADNATSALQIAEDIDKNQKGEGVEKETMGESSSFDRHRFSFFYGITWTDNHKKAIQHAVSFAKRYAEQGDYEISAAALGAIAAINGFYTKTKGKTFFARNYLIDNPLESDGFINDTLEHMRQNIQAGLARRDEKQIEQTLHAMFNLVGVYLRIDYSIPNAPNVSKYHAHLAAGYLAEAARAVFPHNMVDVLLEAQRLMGKSALLFLHKGSVDDSSSINEKIVNIARLCCMREDHYPAVMVSMEQLANLTFELLRSRNGNVERRAEDIREKVFLIVNSFLSVPDDMLSRTHAYNMSPYYSLTSMQSFAQSLFKLAEMVQEKNLKMKMPSKL